MIRHSRAQARMNASLGNEQLGAAEKNFHTAVAAARVAFSQWSGFTAYQRGQIMYCVAEVCEERRAEFTNEIMRIEHVSKAAAERQFSEAIDLWWWYTGWVDKYMQCSSFVYSGDGPYVTFSRPEPLGVVGVHPPQDAFLKGFVSAVASALVSGNTVVVAVNEKFLPLAQGMSEACLLGMGEACVIRGVPSGVVNVVAGPAEIDKWLVSHPDVNTVDAREVRGLDTITSSVRTKTVRHTKSLL